MNLTLAAVALTSAAGSLHCLGMCGGIAAAAAAAPPLPGAAVRRRSRFDLSPFSYQLGRLIAYLVLGALAGAVGASFDHLATDRGLGLVAALLSGVTLVGWGVLQLATRLRESNNRTIGPSALLPSPRRRLLDFARIRFSAALAFALRLPAGVRGLWLGLLTGALPCGWLYAYVVLAMGSGGPIAGATLMAAFWLGAVPALSLAGALAKLATARIRGLIPVVSAVAVLLLGLHNVWAHSNLTALEPERSGASDALAPSATAPVARCH